MIITAIDGSPKPKDSNSGTLLSAVTSQLKEKHTIHTYSVSKAMLNEEAMDSVLQSDVIIFSFPLYVDGIPSNMLRQMIAMEKILKEKEHKDIMVYVIVNNGFYEGEQNVNAIEMVKHFSKRAGVGFGQGIGVGTGEMLGMMIRQGMPVGKAVLTNLGKILLEFIHNIEERKSADNLYVRPNFPWHGFSLMSKYSFWNAKAKANGVSPKQLKRRLTYSGQQTKK